MAILPATLRRRMRSSGFTEEQTDTVDEVLDAAVAEARVGVALEANVQEQFHALQLQVEAFRAEMTQMQALLRAEMNSMKSWLFGSIMLGIATATAIILAAIAIWG